MSHRLPIVFAVGGSLLSTTVLAQTYIVTDLPTLDGSWAEARAINNAGQIAGRSELPNGDERAVLWNDGVLMDLGTLGGDESRAYALNEAGDVVGTAQTVPNGGPHAFLWQDGVMLDLGTFDGTGISRAYGLNDAGQVVGFTHITGGSSAFVWSDGVMLLLDPAGCSSHDGWYVDNAGLIVGSVRTERSCDERAAIWNVTGELVDVLDGVSHNAIAYARNAAGTVVGADSGPVVWQDESLVEIASPFPALIQGDARDINVHGQVVGFFSLGNNHKAFLWDDGEVLDLTTSLAGGL